MLKKIITLFLFLIFLKNPAYAQEIRAIDAFDKNDRILIIAPHPDDEAIGCAGIIQQALGALAKIKIVYLTNGDHNELAFIVYEKRFTFMPGEFLYLGSVRRQEAIDAMKLLGVNENNLIFLGYPDFGTFTIFSDYWKAQKPFKNMLTRVGSVPYKQDLSFGAPYVGDSILSDFKRVLLDYKPTKIFVSHPADVNGDHKAAYLFLQVALRDLRKEIPTAKVFPYLIHCVGWPKPRNYHPDLSLEPPKSFLKSEINWLESGLIPEQLEQKHKAILCYRSQTASSAFYLLSFARKNELFGDYPDINLANQVSLKERAPEFFGFSRLFANSDEEGALSQKSLIEDQGQVSYAIVDNCLLIRVEKNKELKRNFGLALYLFGYSDKAPFSSMPKIRIITRNKKFRIYDGKKMIASAGVLLNRDAKGLILRIPLLLLGNPDFILTSLKVYGGKLSVDATGFRKIVIKYKGE